MGHNDKGRCALAVQFKQQREHARGVVAIQITGRFIGQHAGRIGHQRARKRGALALTARELARRVMKSCTETDPREHLGSLIARL